MSRDAIGVLFYGFVVDPWNRDEQEWRDEEVWEEADGEYEKYYIIKAGVELPEAPDVETKEEMMARWKEEERLIPCVLEVDGIEGSGNLYLAANGSVIQSRGGSALLLTPDSLKVGEDWDQKIKGFCEVLGIPHQTPGWHLTGEYI